MDIEDFISTSLMEFMNDEGIKSNRFTEIMKQSMHDDKNQEDPDVAMHVLNGHLHLLNNLTTNDQFEHIVTHLLM